ncbi:MAG: hypothetical protein HY547_05175 [Elusimicrobia bacterium]|nr:hypothetical protein [Elusimicrobiota bacterium]
MDFKSKLWRSASAFLAASALVMMLARFLSFSSPLGAGALLGAGLSTLSTLLMLPWKKQALRYQAGEINRPNLAQITLWGSALRFCCLVLIAVWGFRSSLSLGLSGILSFGIVFLVATAIEIRTMLKNRSAHGPA